MCNLYSLTTNQEAIRRVFGVDRDEAGNLPSLPGIFLNYEAPIVPATDGKRVLSMYQRRSSAKLSPFRAWERGN